MPLLSDTPIIFALQGELGAGKTQFAKGVGKALGIEGLINSPTYTIIREYQHTQGTLFHIDTWRLHETQELWELGLKDMLQPGNVIVIEWLEKMRPELEALTNQAKIVWVDIEQKSETERTIRVF